MQNKPNLLDAQMNVSYCFTMNYEQITMNNANKNKPDQTQPVVSLPVPSAVEGSNLLQTQRLSKLFLFFTFLCPSYNLAMQTWTIQKLLNWLTEYLSDKGIDSPRLSAELLLSHVVGLKRIELYTQFDRPVTQQQLDQLHGLVKRASQHEPIAYLTGKTEFYCLELAVSPDCMIPRPETELLVERAVEFLRTRPVRNSTLHKITQKDKISNGGRTSKQPAVSLPALSLSNGSNPLVCDLCTGCGCIAIAIARNYPDADIIATDISDAALAVAAKNIEKHQLKNRIKLLCGDLFDPLVPQLDVEKPVRHSLGDGEFDLIVCNPPYVSAPEFEKLDRNIRDYEPKLALFAGADGLDVYRRIIEKADSFLKADAALMLEIGYAQGQAVRELLEKANCFTQITIEKDHNNNDRIAIAKKGEI
jgi:release factor glutamine methyltransferase